MECVPGWVISSMPGPLPGQNEHERRYTPFIRTRRLWKEDYDGQMIFGDLVGLKHPNICLTGEEKTSEKKTPRKLVPAGDRTWACCVTDAHATACSTAVDYRYNNDLIQQNNYYKQHLCLLTPPYSMFTLKSLASNNIFFGLSLIVKNPAYTLQLLSYNHLCMGGSPGELSEELVT